MYCPNSELALSHLPAAPVNVDDLFTFAASFEGYGIWGGFEPCARAANQVFDGWQREAALPGSLTLLRPALFFESRRERFVDYGGFADDPAGFEKHHDYMCELLQEVRRVMAIGTVDSEDQVVAHWLETNPPDRSAIELDIELADFPASEPPGLDDD